MRWFRTPASLAILSIGLAVQDAAAQTHGRFELGTFGGYTLFDAAEPFEDAAGGGAVLGFYLLRRLSLEAEASFAATTDTAGSESVYVPIRARLLYSQPLSAASRLLVGTGFVQDAYLRDVDGMAYGGSGLVGVQVRVGRSIALRVDGVADYIRQSIYAEAGESWHLALRAGIGVRLGPGFVELADAGRDDLPDPDLGGDAMADTGNECPETASDGTVAGEDGGCRLPDGDADGVPDETDLCRYTPPGSGVDVHGCAIAIADADGDDVPDGNDDCPGTLGGVAVDERGCPLWADADGDGVDDRQDACSDTPPGRAVDARGCSLALDTDADGVSDGDDRCPGTPAGADVDAGGCRLPGDADGDGVADSSDACAGTPGGVAVDARGCPLSPDADEDQDGVRNATDRCPGTPAGEGVDGDGCRILFDGGSPTEILRGVEFVSYDRYELTSRARQILNGVAHWLAAQPGVRVEIASHTDNREYRQYALIRSLGRASAVRRYLVSLGVSGSRLTAVGYGPDQPIADNETAAGRERNERIELRRLN